MFKINSSQNDVEIFKLLEKVIPNKFTLQNTNEKESSIPDQKITGLWAVVSHLSQFPPLSVGANETEKAAVERNVQGFGDFAEAIKQGMDKPAAKGKVFALNKHISGLVYLGGSSLTVADYVYFPTIYARLKTMSDSERLDLAHLTRWCDFIQQTDKAVSSLYDSLGVKKNFRVPKGQNKGKAENKGAEKKAENKGAEKKAENKGAEKKAENKGNEKKVENKGNEKKAENKGNEKKAENNKKVEKKKENKKQAEAPAPVDISRMQFKVGKITEIKKHTDHLYVEQIDVGEEQPRTILSGLVDHIDISELENRLVVVVCNLKPRAMQGVTSQGMVLCGSVENKIEVVDPPKGAQIGERVYFEGFEGEPDLPFVNPKKKVFESLVGDLKTNNDRVACWKDVAFKTSAGVCTCKSLTGAQIK